MNNCPWCDARAIDITTTDHELGFDKRRAYMCIGPENHRWRDGDGPDPEPEDDPSFWQRIKSKFL